MHLVNCSRVKGERLLRSGIPGLVPHRSELNLFPALRALKKVNYLRHKNAILDVWGYFMSGLKVSKKR